MNGLTAGRLHLSKSSVALILVFSALLPAVSTGTIHASTGNAQIGDVNSVPRPSTLNIASSNESVIAGTSLVISNDGVALSPAGVFAIDLAGVTFSGAQFQLYMSTNGFASIGTNDVQYGPTFNTADFSNTTDAWKAVSGSIGLGKTETFYIGSTRSGVPVVAGPIAIAISSSYQFVKIYDGSTGAVASTLGIVNPQPGLVAVFLSTATGPAGAAVTVSGGGFPINSYVDINATYTTHPWLGVNTTTTVMWIKGVPTGNGSFAAGCNAQGLYTSGTCPMVDTREVINPSAPYGPYVAVPILLFAVNASHPGTVLNPNQEGLNSPVFREFSRGIAEIVSYSSSGKPVDTTDGAFVKDQLYGNDTGTTGTIGSITVKDLPPVKAQVGGTLYIAGNNSYAGSTVTFWIGTRLSTAVEMGSGTTANAEGFWNTTVTVPPVAGGGQNLWIVNGGVNYTSGSTVSGTTTTSSTTTSSTTTSSTTTSSTTTSSTTTSSTTTSSTTTSSTTTSTSSSAATSTSSMSSQTTTSHTTTANSSTTSNSTASTTSGHGIPEFSFSTLAIAGLTATVAGAYALTRRMQRNPSSGLHRGLSDHTSWDSAKGS
ncbi:MAG: hypothetical protein JRN27_07985 [Nitrososphaerota archaeon]|nr:hypothetical protein [Nitrososphaerota archaeon]